MHIEWMSLLAVTIVTIAVTVAAVTCVACAATLLNTGRHRRDSGKSHRAFDVGGYALLGLVGLGIVFALWLLIPYFH